MLHAEAFEAFLDTAQVRKSHVSKAAGISASFLADLLAHRAGASETVAANLADVLEVPPAAIFPEIAGWVSPLPDRSAQRTRPAGIEMQGAA